MEAFWAAAVHEEEAVAAVVDTEEEEEEAARTPWWAARAHSAGLTRAAGFAVHTLSPVCANPLIALCVSVVLGSADATAARQSKAAQMRAQWNAIDAKFGFPRISEGPKRLGWLVNLRTVPSLRPCVAETAM